MTIKIILLIALTLVFAYIVVPAIMELLNRETL